MLPQWHDPSHSALKSSSSEGFTYGCSVLQAMSSSFMVSSPCTVLLTAESVGEEVMIVRDFEGIVDCGELNRDDARTEILWAVVLYVRADDVNLRLTFRGRKSDNRVAENMANVTKSYANVLAGCT